MSKLLLIKEDKLVSSFSKCTQRGVRQLGHNAFRTFLFHSMKQLAVLLSCTAPIWHAGPLQITLAFVRFPEQITNIHLRV